MKNGLFICITSQISQSKHALKMLIGSEIRYNFSRNYIMLFISIYLILSVIAIQFLCYVSVLTHYSYAISLTMFMFLTHSS